jgi:hypothetical protein
MIVHNIIQFLHSIHSAGLWDKQNEDTECTDLIRLDVLYHLHKLDLVDLIPAPVD